MPVTQWVGVMDRTVVAPALVKQLLTLPAVMVEVLFFPAVSSGFVCNQPSAPVSLTTPVYHPPLAS